MAGSGTAHLREGDTDLVLQVDHLVVEYPSPRGTVHAVSDISFDLADRETVGIVGESGCGKSTTGKAILRVPPPTSGRVLLDGVDLSHLTTEEMRRQRAQLQMIFQDAISSLNPRRRIREVVGEHGPDLGVALLLEGGAAVPDAQRARDPGDRHPDRQQQPHH